LKQGSVGILMRFAHSPIIENGMRKLDDATKRQIKRITYFWARDGCNHLKRHFKFNIAKNVDDTSKKQII
jgi:hypothetical protein